MNFEFQKLSLSHALTASVDALVVLWPSAIEPDAKAVEPVTRLLAQAMKHGDFELKAGSVLALYSQPGLATRHVVVVGSGENRLGQIRSAMQAAWGALKDKKIKHLGVHWMGEVAPQSLQMALSSLADASYSYTTTLSKPKARTLKTVRVSSTQDGAQLRDAVSHAQALVAGVEWAKEWANRPANHATPTLLSQAAQKTASGRHFKCEVLGPKDVAKLGMGAFMAVAQGAAEPLRFIVMRYNGAAASQAPVVLVGKGITFDTGGISIKPAPEMDEMKYDMGGAASVLGVFKALSLLKPGINVVGLIPATENMPDGQAVKPGDVVTSMSGQTIEILNTDAEGRLVLCDALTYAERFKPQAVIDIATLTGACVIALGAVRTGLFSSDDALALQLQQAGETSGDTCWRMPLDEEYADGLKSRFADVANVAGRAAGSVTAAKFLQRFAHSFPWAHLDIAGTAWRSGAAKGATGRPVALLLQYLLSQAKSKGAQKSGSPVSVALGHGQPEGGKAPRKVKAKTLSGGKF
jgi:leucyl aminopeptidase